MVKNGSLGKEWECDNWVEWECDKWEPSGVTNETTGCHKGETKMGKRDLPGWRPRIDAPWISRHLFSSLKHSVTIVFPRRLCERKSI